MSKMAEEVMNAVEALLRKASKKPKGKMQIRRRHVDKLLSSNAQSRAIGKPRADIIWGCVAELISSRRHTNGDMTLTTSHLELLRARGLAALQDGAKGKSHRVELRGSIVTWLEENEERVEGQPFLLRPGKLNQLKASRQKTLSTKGRRPALMASLTLLAAEGIATLQRTPSKGNKKGKWGSWVEDSVSWMTTAGWLEEGEAESVMAAARKTADEHEIKGEPEVLALNLGEGWRSIAKAVLKKYPTARIVGVDRRGFTWTGYERGYITAEVHHDWSQKSSAEGSDLISAVSKKASVPVTAWDVINLEPECTLFSAANAQNTTRGCAHGKHAEKPSSIANMTPERLAEERLNYAEARAGVVTQLESLERHPLIAFLLENPSNSELWELPEVIEILLRNPQWVIREIDRCAYGRREKKPTKILTNRPAWIPRGRTGNGRCKAGKCTGWLTSSGQTEHPGQTCPNTKEKKLDTGAKKGGKCENAQKAVKNALEEELIAEMYEMIL